MGFYTYLLHIFLFRFYHICPLCVFHYPYVRRIIISLGGFMFMFRRKRSCLVKRLWKARIRKGHEVRSKGEEPGYFDDDEDSNDDKGRTGCCSLSGEGLLRNAVLKRLKDNQLEMLVEAVESGGAVNSTCVLVPKDLMPDPHLMFCQIWRWPDLKYSTDLRRTPACPSVTDPVYICCNPYHWSRLCEPDYPPPPYSAFSSKPKSDPEDAYSSSELSAGSEDYRYGRTFLSALPPPYYTSQAEFNGSLSTDGQGDDQNENEWCKLAYWELSQRVGRLYPVQNTKVNIFWTDVQEDGLSLQTLAHHSFSPPQAVYRNRSKIGLGITLSMEEDGVWAYNRSNWPIFVNSPSLDDPACRTVLVYRVPAGHCFKIFDPCSPPRFTNAYWTNKRNGPVDPNSVRISFAKGWGPKYSRQEVTSCPTWLEVLLSPFR